MLGQRESHHASESKNPTPRIPEIRLRLAPPPAAESDLPCGGVRPHTTLRNRVRVAEIPVSHLSLKSVRCAARGWKCAENTQFRANFGGFKPKEISPTQISFAFLENPCVSRRPGIGRAPHFPLILRFSLRIDRHDPDGFSSLRYPDDTRPI